MKVLIATPYFYPRIGGLEHYAEQTARQLVAAGWEVHIVTSGERTGIEQWEGMTIHRLRTWARLSNTPVSPLWTWQIRRIVRWLRPDVLNVHAPVPSMALSAAAAAGDVPLVVTYHAGSMKKGQTAVDALISVYESWLLPRLLRRAQAIICASDFVRESFLADWQDKSVTITPGVDTELFHPLAASAKGRRVVFIGDFRDPRKGLKVLLEAVKELPGVNLRVVGTGTPEPQTRVRYLGVKRGGALVREIQQATVLVLPSTTEAESFGMVLIEAMACGVPVIGSDIGGIPRVISNGKDGLLAAPGNAVSLRDAIAGLMAQPAFGEQLGQAGRIKAVRHFSWASRGQATDDLLRKAAGGTTKKLSVGLLHNVVSPYRLPLFEEIGRHFDVEVFFCKTKTADRSWDASLAGYRFKRNVLPVFQLGPFFINPTLLWRLVRQPYDIYLVGDFPETAFATFITIAVAKLRRKPVVLWSETVDHEVNYFQDLVTSDRWDRRLVRSALTAAITGYRRFLLRLPQRYIALSSLAKKFLVSEGVSPAKITAGIQVMPATLLKVANTPQDRGPYAGKQVILYLGYLNPAKGIDDLITAFRGMAGKQLRLVIAGSGPAEAQLRHLAQGDDRIEFPGYVGAQDRANLYNWADVMVLPTLVDCWAMVVNEALHYATPVVVTDVAGAAELIADSGAGRIVPPRDPLALRAAITEITTDTKLRRKMAAKALEVSALATDSKVGAAPILEALRKAGGRS